MPAVLKKCAVFFKKETVLCVAVLLALLSMFFVPPSAAYAAYIDWNTLALLFSLMAVIKGFQKAGLFVFLGNHLLQKTVNTRQMLFVLVFSPFLFSMLITNDVSLITFVPFGLIVLRMAGQEKLITPLVVMQTIAANLGSMLTPMGNPQNLYLYTKFQLSFWALCGLMAPYVLLSAVCLALMILLRKSVPVSVAPVSVRLASAKELICCAAGFALCLLAIFKVIPALAVVAVLVVFLLFANRRLLAEVDYALLGTFLAFFIFVGNMGSIGGFKDFLASILSEHVELVSVLASQVISNVPAVLLLSGFTDQWQALAVGCNIGGLGTLIASMASLISYKFVTKEYPEERRRYLVQFTLWNILLLVFFLLVSVFHLGTL